MAHLTGVSFLGLDRAAPGGRTFAAVNPATGEALAPVFHAARRDDVHRACRLAHEAFAAYGWTSGAERAGFLRSVADGLEADGPALVARLQAETALPAARLHSELGRTCHQLRLFAAVADEGSWVDARIDTADPERRPAPRPGVRSMRRPLGPVAVFGSSNFPLAFSVAGGDTASAMAAGNPVIVKAHPLHPGASELVGNVLVAAVRRCGLPAGTFSLLFDDSFEVGQALVGHPLIQGVGFTGSRAGGEALRRLAAGRPQPIPVYAEMGSVNPVVVLPGALRERCAAIAEGLHASFTLGVGQFCTNPGVVLLEAGPDADAFARRLAERTQATPAGPMLAQSIASAYREGLDRLRRCGATLLAEGPSAEGPAAGRVTLWQVDAGTVLDEPRLLDEVFGPSTLLVRCRDGAQIEAVLQGLDGQLTVSLHALPEELAAQGPLLRLLARKAGRLVFGQFPTGVEVSHAMVHGGPYPATSDGGSTSVGTRALERFTRLVAWQNAPQDVLPEELRDANPRGIRRLVDGVVSGGAVK